MGAILLCFCTSLLTVSSAAPTAEYYEQESGYANVDSSKLGYVYGKLLPNNVYTKTPNTAAASTPVAISPEERYYVPSAYDYASSGYPVNMYTTTVHDGVEDSYEVAREMLRYLDTDFMEQVPMARFDLRRAQSYYVPVNTPNMGNLNSHYHVQIGNSAYGVFPSGSVGNGVLPLLLSCSPSVVAGKIVKPEMQVYGSPTFFSSGAVALPDGYSGMSEHKFLNNDIRRTDDQPMYLKLKK